MREKSDRVPPASGAAISRDIESLNHNIIEIDLDEIQVEAMEQRIELALAALFSSEIWDGPGDPDEPCSQFSCTGYWST